MGTNDKADLGTFKDWRASLTTEELDALTAVANARLGPLAQRPEMAIAAREHVIRARYEELDRQQTYDLKLRNLLQSWAELFGGSHPSYEAIAAIGGQESGDPFIQIKRVRISAWRGSAWRAPHTVMVTQYCQFLIAHNR